MAMPTRILIKVNLILIQNRTRKGRAMGCSRHGEFLQNVPRVVQAALNHHCGEVREMREMRKITNAQCPIPHSLFNFCNL